MIEILAPAEHRPVSTLTAPDRPACESARRTTRVAYTALGWVVLFFAFHVYWYLGGSFASPGKMPGLVPHSLAHWIFAVVEGPAWPLGAFVCLAIARGWAHGRLAKPVAILVRLGAVILVLRGGLGVVDDLIRAAGVRTGISGISTKQATGTAHLTWSYWAIETYFLIGGVIFTWLAIRQRQHRRSHARRADAAPAAAASGRDRPYGVTFLQDRSAR